MPGACPPEFLNTLTVSGMPPHLLELKEGMPVMLLLNMDPSNGLVYGTRLIVRAMGRYILDCEVTGGAHAGHRTLLPRINMSPSDNLFPFQWTRRQFPLQPYDHQ